MPLLRGIRIFFGVFGHDVLDQTVNRAGDAVLAIRHDGIFCTLRVRMCQEQDLLAQVFGTLEDVVGVKSAVKVVESLLWVRYCRRLGWRRDGRDFEGTRRD